jgi:hypothetical protein
LTATPSEEGDEEKYGDSGGYQNPRANIFAGDADLGVKDVTQHCGGHHRREDYAEQVSHPKLGRVRRVTPAQFTFQDTPKAQGHFPTDEYARE